MGKGLPKSIIKKYGITKKAWRIYRGTQKATTKKSTSKKSTKKSGGKKRMGNRKFTLPMSIVAPLAASFFTRGRTGWSSSPAEEIMAGRYKQAVNHLVSGWTGFVLPGGPFWDPINSMGYAKMLFVGALVHKAAGYFGINRILARNKIPVIRV